MAATSITGEKVEVPVEGGNPLPAIFFNNKNSKKGVIVLQEWWGMNEQIKEEGREIAQNGNFTTIVPDLYRGKVATDNEEANHLMSNLDWPGAVKDIEACAKFLLNKGCTKVGVTGFCMGGALSLAAAGKVAEISAAAVFYGICPDGLCNPKTIKVPLQLHFGDKDAQENFTDPKSQEVLKEKLKAGNVPHDFYSYDAGHAFTHKGGPLGNYNEEACKLSFSRMYDFFKNKLE